MRWMTVVVMLVVTIGCRRAPPPDAPPPIVEALRGGGPAGATLVRWLAAINAADRAQLGVLHAGEADAARKVDQDLMLAERSGGFRLHLLSAATPTEVTVVVQGKQTGMWRQLTFGVTAGPPHAITTILLRPAPPPAGAIETPVAAFDGRTRAQVVEALVRALARAYVYPETAAAMARQVRARLAARAYDDVTSPAAFADALTADLRAVSHDKHLRVDAGGGPPGGPGGGPPVTISESRRLRGNIAYLAIATFAVPPPVAGDAVAAAMSAAADASALILDVRDNGGGDPHTVALVISYLLGDQPVHINSMYWRIPDRTDRFFTDPHVPGTRFGATKPVFVLTSGRTFSGAEEFAYDLQSLGRATIVGETTGGGAHPTGPVALPHGLVALIPSGRAINPITHTNWEGAGVKPDVPVRADDALATAHALAAGASFTSRAP